MSQSLAVKYRPTGFESVCGQESTIKILNRQIELKQFKNCYLFCGASGCGKTTAARIFANQINCGIGEPIEVDGASNNGVENVKQIIKSASERAIEGEYKIYIIDEAHMLTIQAWNALLKTIEEPPKFTIFIFCTTDPQKIPATIMNRVQRFNFTRLNSDTIKNRLIYICKSEGFENYIDACDYVSRICNGQMRDAIATIEKCASYSNDLSIDNVLSVLGDYSYDMMFSLINATIDGKELDIINAVNKLYNDGADLKLFVNQFLNFTLDIQKYIICKSIDITKFPTSMVEKLNNSINFNNPMQYYGYITKKLLELKNMLKTDLDPKPTVEVCLLSMCRLQ